MRKLILWAAFVFLGTANAQELNCTVKINADKVAGTNVQIYKTLERSLNEFVNKTNWTTQKVKTNERINCSMFITIKRNLQATSSKASIQVESSRPVIQFNVFYAGIQIIMTKILISNTTNSRT